jgi:hypothetical protein
MRPGHVLRREWESLRHGTRSWFLTFAVATGQVIDPSWGPTCGEDDGVAPLHRLIARSPETRRWQLIMDHVDISRSEALARWIADLEGIEQETLGIKGTRGMLHAMKSRAAFVHDPAHRVVCSSTPTHASWMNQVDIWLSLLVRMLLTRGTVLSLHDVRDRVLAFMASSHRTMAKPLTWTSTELS